MKLFYEGDLGEHLRSVCSNMAAEVQNEPDSQLLNADEAQYVAYLVSRYRVQPLVFHWEGVGVTTSERLIPAEQHPSTFNVYPGESYPRQVITYHVPFTGSRILLGLRPSTWVMRTYEVQASATEIAFDIITWRNDAEAIKREADEVTRVVREMAGYSERDVAQHNQSLPQIVSQTVEHRKQQLLERLDLVHSLGVPVRQSGDVPETFAVPIRQQRIVVKPEAPNTAYSPEPALSSEVYQAVLQVLHDAGVAMERHPAIYEGKNEETLRDHLLMVLAPHFESATGESFNRRGQTDILIRYQNSNAFVAECAFWNGVKAYLKKIDQVLSYLTWRDSKAAVLLFVRSKQLQPVLDAVKTGTPEHPCFVSAEPPTGQDWFNCRFHLPDDPTRGVRLAVLCFHFPTP